MSLIIDESKIDTSLHQLLGILPCVIGIKNADSIYVGGNQQFANLHGFKKMDEIIGIGDQDLKCQAAELCHTFVKQDQEAFQQGEIANIDICHYADNQLHVFYTIKKKITDRCNRNFALFSMTEISLPSLIQTICGLVNNEESLEKTVSGSYRIQNPKIPTVINGIHLSKRSSEVLFFLLKGNSSKTIAHRLGLSPRTIEAHAERLKEIFNCYTKSELIEKACNLGYAYIIPPSLFNSSTFN